MDNNFSKIKVIAWDIDNTLYKRSITLEKEIMSVRNRWLANKINISIIQAGRLIDCEYLKTRNYAKALCYLAKISNESHQKIFAHINKKNHLRKDLRLMRLFKTLKTYRHFINSNSNKKHCLDALEALGLKSITFINLTRLYLKKCFILPSSLPNSIYIGDHEEYDILPAKKLGIKTIIVWKRSPYADYYCRSIYEVGRLLS